MDDSYGARRSGPAGGGGGGGRYYGQDDYGRGGYGERPDNRYDERRYGSHSDAREGRRRRENARDDDGRSWFEEARDYARGRSEERGRGASRSHVRCRDIMTRDVTVARRDTTLQEVAAMMRDEDTGVIPVVELSDAQATGGDGGNERSSETRTRGNGKLVGLITDRDVVIRAVADGKDVSSTRVEEIMTTDIHTARANDRVIDAIRKMGDKQVRRIPVVDDNNNLLGIISMADVALETEEDRELADALEENSSGASFWSKIFG
jgi:CBS domain-containing protein